MIKITEGSRDMLPFVEIEITPGRFWFQWWYEVSYWNGEYWTHDYEKDGGGFGLWFVIQEANDKMHECWSEQLDEMKNVNIKK